jgi:hypothetical protein
MRWIVLAFASLLLASCVTAVDQPQFVPGTQVVGVLEYGGKRVPLPEGNWIVLSERRSTNNASARLGTVLLADLRDGIVYKALEVSTNLSLPSFSRFDGYTLEKECERKDTHYIDKKSNYGGGDQECVQINHHAMTVGSKTSDYFKAGYAYLLDRGVVVPGNTLAVYYRIADRSDFLNARFYFNPEAEGFAAPRRADWSTSDWHPLHIKEDPRKVAYLEKIKDWALGWQPKMKAGFSK